VPELKADWVFGRVRLKASCMGRFRLFEEASLSGTA
jgi:hypothetical protein